MDYSSRSLQLFENNVFRSMLVRYVNYTIVSLRGFTKKIQKCTTLDR